MPMTSPQNIAIGVFIGCATIGLFAYGMFLIGRNLRKCAVLDEAANGGYNLPPLPSPRSHHFNNIRAQRDFGARRFVPALSVDEDALSPGVESPAVPCSREPRDQPPRPTPVYAANSPSPVSPGTNSPSETSDWWLPPWRSCVSPEPLSTRQESLRAEMSNNLGTGSTSWRAGDDAHLQRYHLYRPGRTLR